MKWTSLLVDLTEYTVLLVMVYLLWIGKAGGKNALLVYTTVAFFFLTSGTAWTMENTPLLKEYKKYSIWMTVLAILIGLVVIFYLFI